MEDFGGCELGLDVAGADVDILDFVFEGVAVLEAGEANLDAADGGLVVPEFADDAEDVRVNVVGGAGVEDDVVVLLEACEGIGELGSVEEAELVGELQASHCAADVVFADDVEAALEVAVEDKKKADTEADENADQEVGQNDGEEGDDEGEKLVAALGGHLLEEFGAGEFPAGDDEDGGKRGKGDFVEPVGQEKHANDEEGAVGDGGDFGNTADRDVDGAADDDGGDGHAADGPGDGVADTLGKEFTIFWGEAAIGVEFVGGLDVQEGFERGNDGEGESAEVNVWVAPLGEVREAEDFGPTCIATKDRNLDEVRAGDGPVGTDGDEKFIEQDADENSGKRGREKAFLERGFVPENEKKKAGEADECRAREEAFQGDDDFGESVFAIWLSEGHVAFVVGVMAEKVGNLLHDEDDADGGEEAFDDVVGEVVGKQTGSEGAEDDLEEATDHHGEEEGLERAEALGLGEDDGGEAGGRAGDADLSAADGANNESANDACHDACDDGNARGVGDAEAEGDSDEEDDETCHEVFLEIVGWETVRHKDFVKC